MTIKAKEVLRDVRQAREALVKANSLLQAIELKLASNIEDELVMPFEEDEED